MERTNDSTRGAGEDEQIQPLRDGDATATADPADDPAQAEWTGRTPDGQTATGRDPAEIPDPDDEIPAEDLHSDETQPETQGDEPVQADLGEQGQGDLAPEDH